jgi:hypothetical protein
VQCRKFADASTTVMRTPPTALTDITRKVQCTTKNIKVRGQYSKIKHVVVACELDPPHCALPLGVNDAEISCNRGFVIRCTRRSSQARMSTCGSLR